MRTVEVRGLKVYVGDTRILDVKDLELEAGETMLLYGPSGCGKSTLLKVLAGIIPGLYRAYDVEGYVSVLGSSPEEVRGHVFYVPQNVSASFVGSTLEEELELCDCSLDDELEGRLALSDIVGRRLDELSDGQRYRALLAIALSSGSRLVLLDEPTGHLDYWTAPMVVSLMASLMKTHGSSAIVVDHRVSMLTGVVDRSRPLTDYGLPPDPIVLRPAPGRTLLRAEDLAVELGGRMILDGVGLEAKEGEVQAIIGRNGSGKTTLLRVLAGALKPTSGKVEITSRAFYVPQSPVYWFSENTVRKEVESVARLSGSDVDVDSILDSLDLGSIVDSSPYSLSIGEARRLSLAIALSSGSRLVLLDEPVLGLDPPSEGELRVALEELASRGAAVILATHNPEFASRTADEVLSLEGGVLCRS